MLFLTEQDVKDALSGDDAYREAVAVIERVFEQQSAGTTHHLKRTTMTHPQHPGHLWHNIRILPGMAPELGAAAVRIYSGFRGTNRSEIICLFDWEDMRMSAIISDYFLHAIRTSAPTAWRRSIWRAPTPAPWASSAAAAMRAAWRRRSAPCARSRRSRSTAATPENVRSFCDDMRAALGIDCGRHAPPDARRCAAPTSW